MSAYSPELAPGLKDGLVESFEGQGFTVVTERPVETRESDTVGEVTALINDSQEIELFLWTDGGLLCLAASRPGSAAEFYKAIPY